MGSSESSMISLSNRNKKKKHDRSLTRSEEDLKSSIDCVDQRPVIMLSDWMGSLDPNKKCLPIISLAIPGSHNSMTYSISKKSKKSPDAELVLYDLANFVISRKNIIPSWTKTQNETITEQLNKGIRYLFLRVSKNVENNDFYFSHGVFAGRVKPGLKLILDFLKAHKGEIVILDFQHFSGFSEDDHTTLNELILSVFQTILCNRPCDVMAVTLDWMVEKNFRVIVIHRHELGSNYDFNWPGDVWPTIWPNTMDPVALFKTVNDGLNSRAPRKGNISQCVLTPQRDTIVEHTFSDIRKSCAIPILKKIIPWILDSKPGAVNVVIADFVHLQHYIFPRAVISLNFN